MSNGLLTPGNAAGSKLLAQLIAALGCIKCKLDQGRGLLHSSQGCLKTPRVVPAGRAPRGGRPLDILKKRKLIKDLI